MVKLYRALSIALAVCLANPALASRTVTHPFVGVTYTVREEALPRPCRMHIVDIDLAADGLRFRLTPPDGALHTMKQTTLDYLRQQQAQIAINAHFFEPWPAPDPDPGAASLVGIAASDGKVFAPFLDKPPKQYAIAANAPGLNIDARNHASIVHRSTADPAGYSAAEGIALYNTLAGNEQIVTAGRVTAAQSDWNNRTGPRTAIGLTSNQHLILFVVDGRQKGISQGMSVPEVAQMLVKDFGVVEALNLDGGGSSTLAIADPAPRVANVPVGVNDMPGTLRAVGSNLAIFAARLEPASRPDGETQHAMTSSGISARHYIVVALGLCLVGVLVIWTLRRRRSRAK